MEHRSRSSPSRASSWGAERLKTAPATRELALERLDRSKGRPFEVRFVHEAKLVLCSVRTLAFTSSNARIRVNAGLLKWADVAFVMEKKHRQYLLTRFPGETKYLDIEVLNIPDEYQYMDEDLIGELEDVVADYLAEE